QANRMKSPRYRGAIAEVSHQISTGEKVSDAMGNFPDLFGEEVLALMRAGEEAGQLPQVCNELAKGQKKTLKIIKKLKTGMIYPAVVLVLALAVIMVMSFTLVPAVSKLYGAFGSDLPLPTKAIMWVSDFLIAYPWTALIPFAILFAIFKNWGKIYSKPAVQIGFVHMPTAGNIIRKSSAAVTFRTLAMLMESNVRITNALRITAEGAPHIYHRTFFMNVREHVVEGLSLPESFLMESHWLGKDGRNISGLIEISAETGSSTDLLNEIAEDYEEDLGTIANQIEKLLEPITIVILGVMVGFLLYAIYSPIFGLGKVLLPGKDGKQKDYSKLKEPVAEASAVPGK
ncbi:MAG: type II secretion system F family protein, partial [Verrucomicrobiales bacterium]|nr:type II secretion system F family protein [Verrucomicrobiales bacterium]